MFLQVAVFSGKALLNFKSFFFRESAVYFYANIFDRVT